jgi:hypothetical protein
MDSAKSAVMTTGTIGLGFGVAAAQMGLIVGCAATNLALGGLIATKNAGTAAISKGISMEQAVQQQIYNAIGATQELAMHPTEKLQEHANTFLDIANSVCEQILSLPPAEEDPESGLRERVTYLAQRVTSGLTVQANDHIIEPVQYQLKYLLDQLSKCLILIDYVKEGQQWTMDKIDQMNTSVQEFRKKIEADAIEACTTPGEMLLRFIHTYSSKLNEQLHKLREQGAELLSAPMLSRVQAAIIYVEQLDNSFSEAKNIDEVNNKVIDEARVKLQHIAQWSSSIINNTQQKAKQNGS